MTTKHARRAAVKSGNTVLKWTIMLAVALGLIAGSSWWLFGTKSKAKARKACLDRISIMVDRADELSQAWKGRSLPDQKTQEAKTPSEPATAPSPQPGPSPAGSPRPAANESNPPANQANSGSASAPNSANPAPPGPSPNSAKLKPAPPAQDDLTPQDQDQLNNFMRQIQAGKK